MKKYRKIWDTADTALLFAALIPLLTYSFTSNSTAMEAFSWIIATFAASKFIGWVVDAVEKSNHP